MTDLILQALFSGVLIGSVYALVALGLALAFGALGVLSLSLLSAHQMVRAMRPRRR